MTEPKPQRKGRDFAIGFFGSILVAIPLGLLLPIALVIFLITATIIAFMKQRKFIGIGILSASVAVPLLLIGSCFGIVMFSDFL